MHDSDADSASLSRGDRRLRRSRFLRLLAAVGGAVGLGLRGPLLGGNETAAEADSPPSPPAYLASVKLPAAFEGYPAPCHLPDGFKLLDVYTDRRDDFGRGSQELGYWFITSKFPAYPIAGFRPILVFVAKQPQLPWLWKTQGHSSQPRNLTLASGQTVPADYHDGHWVRDAWQLWEKPASSLSAKDVRISSGDEVIV